MFFYCLVLLWVERGSVDADGGKCRAVCQTQTRTHTHPRHKNAIFERRRVCACVYTHDARWAMGVCTHTHTPSAHYNRRTRDKPKNTRIALIKGEPKNLLASFWLGVVMVAEANFRTVNVRKCGAQVHLHCVCVFFCSCVCVLWPRVCVFVPPSVWQLHSYNLAQLKCHEVLTI